MGIDLPRWLAIDYGTAMARMPEVVARAPHVAGVPIVLNVLAFGIVMVITAVLVWGIRESANFNLGMVIVKLVVLGFFLTVSLGHVQPSNWHPFVPNGFSGVAAGAAVVFFAYIGFDAIPTTAEQTPNP